MHPGLPEDRYLSACCTADVGIPPSFRMVGKHRSTNGRKYECRCWEREVPMRIKVSLSAYSFSLLFRLLVLFAAADWQGTVKFCDTSLGYVRHKKGYTVWRGESRFVSGGSIRPADSLSAGLAPCWHGSTKLCKLLWKISPWLPCAATPNLRSLIKKKCYCASPWRRNLART